MQDLETETKKRNGREWGPLYGIFLIGQDNPNESSVGDKENQGKLIRKIYVAYQLTSYVGASMAIYYGDKLI